MNLAVLCKKKKKKKSEDYYQVPGREVQIVVNDGHHLKKKSWAGL